MIRPFIIFITCVSCLNVAARPLNADVVYIDIPAIQKILTKAGNNIILSEQEIFTISTYLSSDHAIVVALAATAVEFLGDDGAIFYDELSEVIFKNKSEFSTAHAVIAQNAVRMHDSSLSVKMESLIGLPYEENDYLCLGIAQRLYLQDEYMERADELLNRILEKKLSNAHAYATKMAWHWDRKRERKPRVEYPSFAETLTESTAASVIAASGGLRKSSYYRSGTNDTQLNNLTSSHFSLGQKHENDSASSETSAVEMRKIILYLCSLMIIIFIIVVSYAKVLKMGSPPKS